MRSRLMAFVAGMAVVFVTSCATTLHEKSLKKLETPARPTRVLVFDPANAAEYPICHTSFINALHELAEVIPVHFVVTYDTRVWGVHVSYTDIDSGPWANTHAAGLWIDSWMGDVPRIIIDADELEVDRRKTVLGNFAENTAAHEIGHMLGLPHVRGPGQAYHDDIEVASEELAIKCIMGPKNHADATIQPLEVAFLREIMNIPEELEHHKGYVTVFMPPPPEVLPDVDGGDSESPSDSK